MKRKVVKSKAKAKAKAKPQTPSSKPPKRSKTVEVTELDLGQGQKLSLTTKDEDGNPLDFIQINGVPVPSVAGIANRLPAVGYRFHSIIAGGEVSKTLLFERV